MPKDWKWADQIDRILELRDQGLTLRQLGARFGVSHERIRQIIHRGRKLREESET